MALILAALAAQAADLITFLWLPVGAERNPVAAHLMVEAAVAAKVVLLVFVMSVCALLHATNRPSIRDGLLLLAALAGAFGCGSNVSVVI